MRLAGLALAGAQRRQADRKENGVLFAEEIAAMDLEGVETVVLSACATAAGDDRAALGLSGVAVRAGARSALGSLWSVSDRASSELIVRFYRELGQPGLSKAQALQHAQQELLASPGFEHPFYWAPFLVINNWL